MSLRVIHVLRKFDHNEWGGTETALERLWQGQRECDVESVVYCPNPARASANERPEIRRFRAFVPILGISRQRRRQMISVGGNLMSFDLGCRLLGERDAAIIHTHTLGRIGGIARLAARSRRIPFVVSIHGGVLDLPANVRDAFNEPVRRAWEWGRVFGWLLGSRLLFRDADCIITCNEHEAALLAKACPGKRIFVQPHAVPLAAYQVDHRSEARAVFPQIVGKQLLLCVGRVDPIKNQAWLLDQVPEIFRRHPGAVLALAGPCTDEPYGEIVKRKILDLALRDRVFLTGGLPQDDPRLIGLMQEARTLFVPSISETFGLVILEAWAAGASVISSRTSGASALIQHQHNGWLFDLEQPESFHEGVDAALLNPALARRMATHGTAVSQRHSLSAVAARLKGLYEELIREKQCTA